MANRITDRNQNTFEKNRLTALLEASTAGIVIVENPDGHISFANKKAVSILGKELFASLSERPSKLGIYRANGTPYRPEETPASRSLKTGEAVTGEELFFLKPDGTRLVLSVNTSPLFAPDGGVEAVISIFEDNTFKNKTEIALRESEEKFSKIFHNNPAAIIINSLDGKVIEANEKVTEIFGYSREEFMGKDFLTKKLYSNEADRENMVRQLLHKGKVQDFEIIGVTKDGQRKNISIASEIIRINNEDCIIGSLLDITARKESEEAVQKAKNDLEKKVEERTAQLQQTLKELDAERDMVLKKIVETEERDRRRFASDLHDDLGPTLSAIKLQLSLLASESLNSQQMELLAICDDLLSEGIEKMRNVANSILPNILESYGLETAAKSFLNKVTNDTHIEFRFLSNLNGSRFDAETELHLYRVVTELITNTIKHSGATKINLDLEIADSVFNLVYSDNGKSYSMATDPSQAGTGLQNIRNRVKLINGNLEIAREGKRTVVRIRKEM